MKNAIANKPKIDSQLLEDLLLQIYEDKKSFQKLYDLTKSSVYGYSLSILKNHEEALDNMQDVYIKIYESIDSYNPKNKPMNWIFTITKNEALMKLRKAKRKSTEQINEEMLISPNANNEDRLIIKDLIEKLSEEERTILIMYLIGGLKHKDIAKLLDLKLSTVLSKYHRTVKKLRLEWKEV